MDENGLGAVEPRKGGREIPVLLAAEIATALPTDAQEPQDNDQAQRQPEQPKKNKHHFSSPFKCLIR
jgi:hypothetical protein